MSRPYTSTLDPIAVPGPLPLTESYAKYLRDRVASYEADIDMFNQSERTLLADLGACRALRAQMVETLERYRRGLGPQHVPPHAEPQHWPIIAEQRSDRTETCQPCGQPMVWTENYGFVHEIDGNWVAAGQWCAQAARLDATTVLPAIESEATS